MRYALLISVALLGSAGTAHAQLNGSGNGNGNTGFFNGNFNGNGAGHGSGVGIGVGLGGSATATGGNAVAHGGQGGKGGAGGKASASASNSTSFKEEKQAPGIGLAGLAVGGLSCRGSMSIGGSGPGFSLGFGTTTPDDECERRQWAGMLASARDPRARALAWAIMARSAVVQQAMQDTGIGVAQPVTYAGQPVYRGGTSRVTASAGCHKWSGGAQGVGTCVY